jgi:steroid delta-isomerase-like uncharacterized protein
MIAIRSQSRPNQYWTLSPARGHSSGMPHPNRLLIERYFHQLFNQGRVELVDTLLHPDYVNHSPGSPDQARDRDAVKGVVLALREAFPDLHYRIEDLVVAEDAVAARTTLTGTHLGSLFGLPATGKAVRVSQFNLERVRDGRIITHHRLTDDLVLHQQLGLC